MKYIGKITGAVLGFIVGGPYGLAMGTLCGHLFDVGYFKYYFHINNSHRTRAERVFFEATFLTMGHLAKADGQVSTNEIQIARHIMIQLQLSSEAEQEAIALFKMGKEQNFNLIFMLNELKQACQHYPTLLKLFVDIQLQTAYADHRLSTNEKMILLTICEELDLSPLEFRLFNESESQEKDYSSPVLSKTPLEIAYQTLNIAPSVNDTELKKTYRRLMNQHHPDKLIAKGLPIAMLQIATQKTQEIKAAYELICKERGLRS